MANFETQDGLRLYYTDTADSTQDAKLPLICLPGLTRCGLDFRYFAPHAQAYRIITLDARGRGRSAYDNNFMNYNVLQEAQDVLALMDHLGLKTAAILGTSRGGLVAMTLAATAKDRLAAVILNDVGPEIPSDGLARIMDYLGRKPAAKTLELAAQQLHAAMAPAFPDVPSQRWREEVETFYTQTDDGLDLRYDAKMRDALLAQAQALGDTVPDLWPMYMALEGLPLGVLRGANSDILSAETFQKMRDAIPSAVAQEIPNRGHVPFLDEPEAVETIHTVLEQTQWQP
ncbi:alpha/beta fold hydrolase [Epibacterium sp. SM1979]|uniref:Alpha/beta fold hydrolase n=1 Tax=Tritonibacter litoralis TaxID=2662264 RepID=A0A843YJA0_9RHOB|nr:alpha/beta hydrolase [Tritonibacter litoralis]MQQ09239.1 alpha/beta fold hydrolase [Tritonibacter litoralis]